ncbi:MAG: hypothetical protein Q8K52_10440 [Thiobacillus sp.]|nr:hypothetical protein [Thiobacillus sp.]
MNHAEIVALIYSELLKVAGGAAVLLAALSAFLGRIWMTRIASREAATRDSKLAELKASFERQGTELKARLDIAVQRTVFVDKLQFEHEYKIYQQAWEHLFALRHATLALRPILDTFDPAENGEDRMKRRMGAFAAPHNTYLEVVHKNKPFYPEKVYAALDEVREKCRTEVDDYEYIERPRKEYWAEARKNREEILTAIDAACEAIRTRIAEVRVA